MIPSWNKVPDHMRSEPVRRYYDILCRKRGALVLKRFFDILFSLILIVILAIPMLVIAVMVKSDSKGPVMYRQERVTQYGRVFRIFKFRTMVDGADKMGAQVTSGGDARITKVGAKLRKNRLDEFPQLFNVLAGDMSFVGTRPEVPAYVKTYTDEMKATLLLPAGVTSRTSIAFKDESELIDNAADPDRVYTEKILPEKMKYNLEYLEKLSIGEDISILICTIKRVL